jgi:hypothetical protein
MPPYCFKNNAFNMLEDDDDNLVTAVNALLVDKNNFQSIVYFDWIKKTI